MHSAMRNKFLAKFFLASIFLVLSTGTAQAVNVPELQWERGHQQSITLGGVTNTTLWTIRLSGMGKSLTFDRSSPNKDGYIVYSVDIPDNFPVGKYRVITSGPNMADTTSAYINVIEIVSYDPLSDPKGVGAIAVVTFTLLSFFGLNREDQKLGSDANEEDASSLGSVDTNYQGIKVSHRGKGDDRKWGKSSFARKLDEFRHLTVFNFSSKSPLTSRLAADGSYLQSLIGPLSLVMPIIGLVLGSWIAFSNDIKTSLVPTSVGLMIAIIILGILDAFSGLVAITTFGLIAIASGAITNVIDVRTLLGLALLWFTPSLAAGATRPLRRERSDWDLWERLTDLLVSTFITGWAIKSMVLALDGFSHEKTPFATNASQVALIGGAFVFVRYLLEEFTSRHTPERLEYLTPPKLKGQEFTSLLITLLVRVLLYVFFMYGFFGLCWQIFAATALLITPSLLKTFQDKLPNNPWLFQVLPGGVPSIVVMSFVGFAFSKWVNTWPLLSEDKTKTILILTSLPGFIVGLIKLFARSAKKGDVRWYRRENLKYFYRFAGPLMFAIAVLITIGVIP
jgi:hypothetical protein